MTSPNDTSLAERYRLLVELSPDAIVVHQQAIIVYANPATLRFARVSDRSDVVGRAITDFVHPDHVPMMVDRIMSMGDRPGASTVPEETMMVDTTGAVRLMEVTSVRTMWDGEPAFQVILRDMTAAKEAEAALRRQAALLDHVSNAVISIDLDLQVQSFNPAAEHLYGHAAHNAIGASVAAAIGADIDPAAILAVGGTIDEVHHRADGTAFVAHISVTSTGDGYLIVAEATRRPLIERLGKVLSSLHQAVLVVGGAGVIELANPAAITLLGHEAVPGAAVHTVPMTFADHRNSPIQTCLTTGREIRDITATVTTPSGPRWLSCSCRPIDLDDSTPSALVSFTDVTDRHEAATRLAWDASHDYLTGLLNRAGLITALDTMLAALHSDAVFAVFYIDLDGFSLVNNSLGHATGDQVLRTVGQRLHRAQPAGSVAGRLGGDEFVLGVLLPPGDVDTTVHRIAHSLREAMVGPVWINGRTEPLRSVDMSVGIATATDSGSSSYTAEELLRNADIALYQAKGSPTVSVMFEPRHLLERQRRQQIEEALRRVLDGEHDPLQLHYQPIVDSATGQLVGLEALARWSHPDLGVVSPGEFIPIAEESSLIDDVDTFVFRTATTHIATHPELASTLLCINVSRRTLHDGKFLTRIGEDLAIEPARVCLEITESAVIPRDDTFQDALQKVRAAGFHVALDDFGTGTASLSELSRMPATFVKVAGAFIEALDTTTAAHDILSAIVSMVHAAGMRVIAEGVETTNQATAVGAAGCDYAQGFHYGRPQPLRDIIVSLQATETQPSADA
ncbi:EAL domain-containing protein [Gordonia sp. CPCC 205515]|uniref:sensor domain-containing protein n=1 Tax=Gordonia sp. CPCC 205515 TaxID=3140791 RepID=UPI003AF3BCF5